MDTLKKWELFSKQMIQCNSIAHERRMNHIAQCFKRRDKSDKSDKSDKRPPSPPPPIKPKMLLEKDWKSTPLAEFYTRKVYGQPDLPPPPKPDPPKPDPLRPHEFPLRVIRHKGRATDKTNFTHLQELWDGVEKPLEIQTAGHRERNLTTQIK